MHSDIIAHVVPPFITQYSHSHIQCWAKQIWLACTVKIQINMGICLQPFFLRTSTHLVQIKTNSDLTGLASLLNRIELDNCVQSGRFLNVVCSS